MYQYLGYMIPHKYTPLDELMDQIIISPDHIILVPATVREETSHLIALIRFVFLYNRRGNTAA